MRIDEDRKMESALQSAVVLNWEDLVRGAPGATIQVEYAFAPGGTLAYVRVWSSTLRGYWLLACAYWMSASGSHDQGAHFDNGYRSDGLAHILEFLMQHQNSFAIPHNFGGEGSILIATPTAVERRSAAAAVSAAVDRVTSQAS